MKTDNSLYTDGITTLKYISDYFHSHTNTQGVILCSKHRVEHIAKSAYSIGINDFLFEFTNDGIYLKRILTQVHRICERYEFYNGNYTLANGTNSKWNMSSNIIDTGSTVDMLVLVQKKYSKYLEVEQAKIIKLIIIDRCSKYLISATVEKAHTNQRLWGATGLAHAYSQEKIPAWKDAVLESINKSYKEIRDDGSIPYITNYQEKGHLSYVNDISCNYQSRHIVFIWYSLEQIGELSDEHITKMKPAVDFLIALYGEPGIKNMKLETKRWYYLSDYEVASNVFDIYVLLKMYQVTNDSQYAYYGLNALQQIIKHTNKTEGIREHNGKQENFLCQQVVNSHALWLARSIEIAKDIQKNYQEYSKSYYGVSLESGVVHVKNNTYEIIVRGKKKPSNAVWGSRIGGGSIIYFSSKTKNNIFRNKNGIHRLSGNFYINKFQVNPLDWFCVSRSEISTLISCLRTEIHARNFHGTYLRAKSFITSTICLFHTYSSAYATAVACKEEIETNRKVVTFDSYISNQSGVKMGNNTIIRKYIFTRTNVVVYESMKIAGNTYRINYVVHPDMKDVRVQTDGVHKRVKSNIIFSKGASCIDIRYILA